jgi:Ca2+-binding EF-hand superfamily protein
MGGGASKTGSLERARRATVRSAPAESLKLFKTIDKDNSGQVSVAVRYCI